MNNGQCDCIDGSDEANGCTPCKLNNGVYECHGGSDEEEGNW